MSAGRCPMCSADWGRARVLKGFPMYGRCRCGLVGRVGAVTEDYGDDYFDTDDPSHGHRDFTSAWATEYDRRRFTVELDRIGPPRAGGRLLDIGAATGGFLKLARSRGWSVLGVEPAAGARRLAAADGIDLVADLADLANGPRFDVITLHHVLEHLTDPVEVLRAIRMRLIASGRVVIEVPNWRSTERMAAGTAWVDLRPEQHRWQFTPATLQDALRRAGYATLELDTLGDPMPSPGTVLLSLGVPVRLLPAGCSNRSRAADERIELRIRAEHTPTSRIARLVDRPVGSLRLGKRLLAIAAPQESAPTRAGALSITAP